MSPEKRKRIRKRHEEWLRTDPLQQRLRERVEHHRALAEQEAQERRERS